MTFSASLNCFYTYSLYSSFFCCSSISFWFSAMQLSRNRSSSSFDWTAFFCFLLAFFGCYLLWCCELLSCWRSWYCYSSFDVMSWHGFISDFICSLNQSSSRLTTLLPASLRSNCTWVMHFDRSYSSKSVSLATLFSKDLNFESMSAIRAATRTFIDYSSPIYESRFDCFVLALVSVIWLAYPFFDSSLLSSCDWGSLC